MGLYWIHDGGLCHPTLSLTCWFLIFFMFNSDLHWNKHAWIYFIALKRLWPTGLTNGSYIKLLSLHSPPACSTIDFRLLLMRFGCKRILLVHYSRCSPDGINFNIHTLTNLTVEMVIISVQLFEILHQSFCIAGIAHNWVVVDNTE